MMNLYQVADELSRCLAHLPAMRTAPVFVGRRFQTDHWLDYIPFLSISW
jgi:hypothetical protein